MWAWIQEEGGGATLSSKDVSRYLGQGRNGDVAGRYARRPIRVPDVEHATSLDGPPCGSCTLSARSSVMRDRRQDLQRICLVAWRLPRSFFLPLFFLLSFFSSFEFPKLWCPSAYWASCTRSQWLLFRYCCSCCPRGKPNSATKGKGAEDGGKELAKTSSCLAKLSRRSGPQGYMTRRTMHTHSKFEARRRDQSCGRSRARTSSLRAQ